MAMTKLGNAIGFLTEQMFFIIVILVLGYVSLITTVSKFISDFVLSGHRFVFLAPGGLL